LQLQLPESCIFVHRSACLTIEQSHRKFILACDSGIFWMQLSQPPLLERRQGLSWASTVTPPPHATHINSPFRTISMLPSMCLDIRCERGKPGTQTIALFEVRNTVEREGSNKVPEEKKSEALLYMLLKHTRDAERPMPDFNARC